MGMPMAVGANAPGIGAYYNPAQMPVTANPIKFPMTNVGTNSNALARAPQNDVMVRSVGTPRSALTEGTVTVKGLFGDTDVEAYIDVDGNVSVPQSKFLGFGSDRHVLGRVDREGRVFKHGFFGGEKQVATLTEDGTETDSKLNQIFSKHGWHVENGQYNSLGDHFQFNGTFTKRQQNGIMYLLGQHQVEQLHEMLEISEMFAVH